MSLFRSLVALVAFAAVLLLLAACGSRTATSASCAFIVGNGEHDANLHRILYPGQSVPVVTNEKISYVPCNSRNYIINDGTETNANGEKVGDRFVLIEATTSSGVRINIAARALWTLNQSDRAMRSFYAVCHKYSCASEQDIAGTANSSTPGWNRMLGENFGPTMETIGRMAAFEVQDSIWQTNDPAQYKALADRMSAAWADVMRVNLGYADDLFCGSGNSSWSDPNRPGEGIFTCSPVRIAVDDVRIVPVQSNDSGEGGRALNERRVELAKILYGDDYAYWLGLQDLADKCTGSCTIKVESRE